MSEQEKPDQSIPLMNKGLGELTESWAVEDKNWLNVHVPMNLRTVAARHGRQLFTLVMRAGATSHCLSTLAVNVQHMELKKMLSLVGKTVDELLQAVLKAQGNSIEQFKECQRDIERVAALQDAGQRLPGERVSKGGIILDS